jgi:hypothetical protein
MRWVRTNRQWSAWLALAAMTLQLVLSFGHVHLEKFAAGSAIVSLAAFKAPSSQQNPAQHPANEADDYCAICANIHLASSSFLIPAQRTAPAGAVCVPNDRAFRQYRFHFCG